MTRGRPFQPGNNFGRGRPPGSRNKRTLFAQKLLEEHSPALMALAITKSREDRPMLRLLVGSIMRGRRETVKLGKLALGTFEDLDRASETIIRKAAAGQISLGEAARFSALIDDRRRVLETRELEHRVSNLEKAGGLEPRA